MKYANYFTWWEGSESWLVFMITIKSQGERHIEIN